MLFDSSLFREFINFAKTLCLTSNINRKEKKLTKNDLQYMIGNQLVLSWLRLGNTTSVQRNIKNE